MTLKAKLILSFLILLFFGPMVIAWVLYKSPSAWHTQTTNYGQLINPPLDFSQFKITDTQGLPTAINLPHRWILLYLATASNVESDPKNLYIMRQVRTALGKDRTRVDRMLVTFPPQQTLTLDTLLSKDYAGTLHVMASVAEIQNFFGKWQQKPIALPAGTFYLVDPLNNVIMQYSGDIAPKKLLQDLNRLLKVSKIG